MDHPQGFSGVLVMSRADKEGKQTGEEAAKQARGAEIQGAKRELGRKSRAERQRVQEGRWRSAGVDAYPGGHVIQDHKIREVIEC